MNSIDYLVIQIRTDCFFFFATVASDLDKLKDPSDFDKGQDVMARQMVQSISKTG